MIPVVGFVLRRRIHPRLHLRSQARLRLVGGKGRGGRGLVAVSADEKRLKSRGWERTFGCDSWRVRGAPRRTRARGETPAPPGAATPEEGRRGMPCSLPEVCGARQRDGTGRKESSHDVVVRLRPRPANPEMPTHKPRTGNLSSIYKRGWPIPIITLAVAKHVNCKSIAPCARTSKQSPCPSGLRGRT